MTDAIKSNPAPAPETEPAKVEAEAANPAPTSKPAKPVVYVLANGKLTTDGLELLEMGITRTAEAIADGLRQFIENKIELGQAQRGALENAFEAARSALKKRPTVDDLVAARASLETVSVLLANHSVRDTQALNRAKQALFKSAAVLEAMKPAK